MKQLTRRRAVTGAAAVTGLSLLAACGDDATGTATDPASAATSGSPTPDESSPTSARPSATKDTASEPPPRGFASTADVPERGGTIFADEGVIVTQPQPGTFRGFKNACTHQGCPLQGITDTINCDCHGSRFALDGSVVNGPATSPLAEQAIRVEGDQILLA